MKFTFRPPKLKITKTGVHLVKPSVSVGSKDVRLNISSKGVSVSAGEPGAAYNTRQGLTINPLALLRRLVKGKKK